ncbi:MAG: alpha/beta hydrolase [Pseudomonadota bacterium]
MNHRTLHLLYLTVILLLPLYSNSTSGQTISTEPEWRACHIKDIESRARCTTVAVPEDWQDPSGKHISLHVAVVPPSGGQAVKEPLYLLAGGPGQAATSLGRYVAVGLERARRGREVVLVDQRGTGGSTPFGCRFETGMDVTIKGDQFARDCLAGTDNQSEHYHSDAFMQDLNAVRERLGHTRINLVGGSYGTRAALLYLRKYPSQVNALVLDAVAAPETAFFERFLVNASRAIDNLMVDCAADEDCARAFPDLADKLAQTLASLERESVILERPNELEVTPDVFLNAMRNALYTPLNTAQLPLVIDAAANGDFGPWRAIAGSMNGAFTEMSVGTLLSVLCGEEIASTSAEAIAALSGDGVFSNVSMAFWFDACRVWPHRVADTAYRDPVVSDVPALILSGELDPVTPPAFGEVAASRLPNSRHLVAPHGGHTIGSYGCIPTLVADFLDSLDVNAIDEECLMRFARDPYTLSAYGPHP